MSEVPTYVLEQEFAAPRELVWKAWTDPELLQRWYGPGAGTIVHRIDLEVRGLALVEMRWNGNASYQRSQYTEIIPPERLVWLHSVADSDWNIIPNPNMEDWPQTLLTTVTLEEAGGRTTMRLTWEPHDASAAEIACFSAALDGLDKGWSVGMELFAELLAEQQA